MHNILIICQTADEVIDMFAAEADEVASLCRRKYDELMEAYGSADVKAWPVELLDEEPTDPSADYLVLDGTDGEVYFCDAEMLFYPPKEKMLFCRDSEEEAFERLLERYDMFGFDALEAED